MKKLLVIAPQNPYPATDGGKISIYHPLINLAAHFQIHFVFTYFRPLPSNISKHFSSYGISIYPQKLDTQDTVIGIISNLFSKIPYKFQKYHSKKILERLAEIVKKEKIDLVWCNHSHMGWYGLELKKQFNVKIFLREHNIEYSLVEQAMQLTRFFLLKKFIQWQFFKTKKHEMACWNEFNKTFFISDFDFNVAKTSSAKNLDILYDGFPDVHEETTGQKEPFSFVFTGNISTFQNRHNLQQFIAQIWGPLIKKDSRWKLYVTGNDDKELQKFQLPKNLNIVSLGFVAQLSSVIASKKYFVSPTYIGSGMRIKVLNAMAAGAVCFLTPLDAEMAVFLKHSNNIIRFNNFPDFYTNLMDLESNVSLYNSISLQAKTISAAFSWKDYAVKVFYDIERL